MKEEPVWNQYDENNSYTKAVKELWIRKDLGGGPLTGPLQTATVPSIETPMKNLIKTTPDFGFFEMKKI